MSKGVGVSITFAMVVAAPLLALVLVWEDFDQSIWLHLLSNTAGSALFNTFSLTAVVVLGATAIGVLLGWWSATQNFPRWLDMVLVLPMTIPKYVLGFVYLSLFDYSGAPTTLIRQTFGWDWSIGTGALAPLAFVMILALYPYVFLLVRAGLACLDADTINAGRLAGASEWSIISQIAVPALYPWILSGAVIVGLETLADFGTVAVFNYDTFTTLIYKSWFGLYSFSTAGQLASVLVIVAVAFFFLQGRANRFSAKKLNSIGSKTFARTNPIVKKIGMGLALFTVCAGFLVPVISLIQMTISADQSLTHLLGLVYNTALLATIVAALVVVLGVTISFLLRHESSWGASVAMTVIRLGYGIPGIVLAVGILLIGVSIDRITQGFFQGWDIVLTGTILATCWGLLSRFFILGLDAFRAQLSQLPNEMEEMAYLVGANSWRVVFDIYRPLLTGTAAVTFLIVFVEVAKEMPITLMTRTFGFDTLSIKVFEFTSEGLYEFAAAPSLLLVALGAIPMILISQRRGFARTF